MAESDVFPIINCSNLATTRAWYETVFSGTLAYRFPDDGEPEYLTLSIGSGQVALGNGTVPAMYGRTPRPASGHAVDLCIYVPDLDGVIAAAADSVAVAPADMPWGERVAYLRDPEGTMLLVIQGE